MGLRPTVMIISAEFWPLAKTGGLGDMVHSIATSLRDNGFNVRVLLPGYRTALERLGPGGRAVDSIMALGHSVELETHQFDGIEVVVAKCGELYDRAGNLYLQGYRRPWSDNGIRFGVLCKSAAMIINGDTRLRPPDAVHILDWHAALTPAYIRKGSEIPIVLTAQALMFQGRFPSEIASALELTDRADVIEYAKFFDGFGFLQVGLRLSDVLTTASEGYIADLKRRDRYNYYYLKQHDLDRMISITNWPETDVWNPNTDIHIKKRYSIDSLDGRKVNKRHLESYLGWKHDSTPIVTTLSRITRAKGFNFLYKQIPCLLDRGFRIIFCGEGESPQVNGARNLAQQYPGRVAILTPYHEADARLVLAGADMLAMPSLTEPCGLSQQHAQIYGCIPVVSAVGGLRDTVTNRHNGFVFEPSNRRSFLAAMDEALEIFNSDGWRRMQLNCMQSHSSIPDRSAYAKLFRKCLQVSGAKMDINNTVDERVY